MLQMTVKIQKAHLIVLINVWGDVVLIDSFPRNSAKSRVAIDMLIICPNNRMVLADPEAMP